MLNNKVLIIINTLLFQTEKSMRAGQAVNVQKLLAFKSKAVHPNQWMDIREENENHDDADADDWVGENNNKK